MANEGQDLRTFLEHARAEVQELLRVASKLVLEVRASHYWTTYGIEVLGSLRNIGNNLHKLLDGCAPYWGEGKQIFEREEAQKLWKTAVGVYQAIPPIAAKFNDQLDKRRKQRIMGQTYDELPESTPEAIQEDLTTFTLRFGEVQELFTALDAKYAAVPERLAPDFKPAQPSANGLPAAAPAQPAQAAAPPAVAPNPPPSPPTEPGPAPEPQQYSSPQASAAQAPAVPQQAAAGELQQTEPGIWTIVSPRTGGEQNSHREP